MGREHSKQQNSMCKDPVADPFRLCTGQGSSTCLVSLRKANSKLLRDQIDEIPLPKLYKEKGFQKDEGLSKANSNKLQAKEERD